MKKEKVIISLLIMVVLFALCSMSVFATDVTNNEPATITTITANGKSSDNDSDNTEETNNAPTAITPDSSNSNAPENDSTTISSYNTNVEESKNESSELPYTGTSYTVVFVIIALAISAVYAYKKISDYNV